MIILASYRLTHLIVFDKITEFIRNPFMKKIYDTDEDGHPYMKKVPKNNFGYLLNCYWCAGVWASFVIGGSYLLYPRIATKVVFILSIAGAQAIIETFVGVGTKTIDYLSTHEKRVEQK